MRFLFLLFLTLFYLQSFSQDLVILHTNDMHSHLNGFAPETEYTPFKKDNDQTLGGFARIAGFIKQEKAKNKDKLLVLDAGDFLMGTLFHSIEPTHGFQLNLMHEIGYDYVAIGNHEFDYGVDMLTTIIKNNKKLGKIPQLLLTNRVTNGNADIDEFNKFYENNTILPFDIFEKNNKTIGIFSLMGVDAQESISTDYQLKFENVLKTARKTAKYLKKQGADIVILLSHTGVSKSKKGDWQGEDYKIGKTINDIDLIISGHSHTELATPLQAGNTMIVQTGEFGQKVGKIEIYFDPTGKPLFQYSLIPMNDEIIADKSVQNKIDYQAKIIEKELLAKFDLTFNKPICETNFNLIKDERNLSKSNLGPFIADAVYNAVHKIDTEGIDVVLVASGIIRNNMYTGNYGQQNIADIFNIMPLGYDQDLTPGSPLGKFYTTGYDFKKVLELILAVSPKRTNYYLYFSGLEIDYNPHKGLFKKISDIRIGNDHKGFKSISFSKKDTQLISVATNIYMIGFIERLKKMSWGIVNVSPKDKNGETTTAEKSLIDINPEEPGIQKAKEWYFIYNYVNSFIDLNGNQIPDIPKQYQNAVNPLFIVN